MKKCIVSLTVLYALYVGSTISASTPFLNLRSQSANLALEMVGQEEYINRETNGEKYTVLSFTPGYFRSFSGRDLS